MYSNSIVIQSGVWDNVGVTVGVSPDVELGVWVKNGVLVNV